MSDETKDIVFLLLFNHNHLQEIMTTSEWFLFSKLWSWFWTTTGLSWTTQWMLYTVQELLALLKNLSSLYLFLWSSFYPCGCFFPGLSLGFLTSWLLLLYLHSLLRNWPFNLKKEGDWLPFLSVWHKNHIFFFLHAKPDNFFCNFGNQI